MRVIRTNKQATSNKVIAKKQAIPVNFSKKASRTNFAEEDDDIEDVDPKIRALASLLMLDDEDIENIEEVSENDFEINGGEYLVLDNSEADEAFEEGVKNFIDEMGISGFSENFQEEILQYCLETSWFEQAMEESNRSYAEDIRDEDDSTYGNRLVQECYDRNLIDDSDFEEDEDGEPIYDQCLKDENELIDLLADDMNEGDAVEWYRDNFGEKQLSQAAVKYNLIDEDEVVKRVKMWDGRGPQLASYDGEESEEVVNGETYFIYRVN